MAFVGRLLGLIALSAGLWFVPIAILVSGGSFNSVIPVSQGLPRYCVLLVILLLPPLLSLILASAAFRKNLSLMMSNPIDGGSQVSSFGRISEKKQRQLVDYARGTKATGLSF